MEQVAEAAKQTGHGVTHSGNDPKQDAQHNRDMHKVERLHKRGEK
jgi:hypothetical protein